MFQSLNSALKGQIGSDGDNCGLILVSHTPTASPSGVIVSFVGSSLASGQPVCLVTLHNTWGHYCNIGNKLGLNLRQQQELGNVKVVDGLKLLSGVLDADSDHSVYQSTTGHNKPEEDGHKDIASKSPCPPPACCPPPSLHHPHSYTSPPHPSTSPPPSQSHPFGFIMNLMQSPLKNLYNLIKQAVQSWKENGQQFQLILENVSSFLSMGVYRRDIDVFVNYCRGLTGRCIHSKCSSLSGKCTTSNCGSLIVITTVEEHDDDANHLTTTIAHSASLHVAMQPLSTGQSREIHGQLTISAFDRGCPSHCLPNVQHFHYKLEEKNLKLFAPGTSPNIL